MQLRSIREPSGRAEEQSFLDAALRLLVTAVGVSAALLLITESMNMNYSFWSGQGADAATGRVLGAVSIGIDAFKATLPLIISWGRAERSRGIVIGRLFFCGCLLFSFISAIGFAVTSRGVVNDTRETVSLRHAAAEKDLKDISERLTALGASRPSAVVEEAIGKARQDRRWLSSNQCKDATVEQSRAFCRSLGDLRMELASSVESERMRQLGASLKAEIDQLLSAGARREADPQAELFARLSGFNLDSVQTARSLLFALLVELGAAFGLRLALLPLSSQHRFERASKPGRPAPEPLRPMAIPRKGGQGPTRFARLADGRLVIE